MRPLITLSLAALAFSASPAFADEDRGLPAEQVIAAIQAAVAERPGQVKEVEVDDHRGKTTVKVEIVGADGKEHKVRVDAQSRQVVR